MTVLVSKEIIF